MKPEKHELELALQTLQEHPLLGAHWQKVVDQMGPEEIEQTARQSQAIQRFREIRSASDLLRLILVYALSDWGLRLCGAWAWLAGIGYLSDVAILKRFRKCRRWLGLLVGQWLQRRGLPPTDYPATRIRIWDATCVSRPGSRQTDWRIHLSFDLGRFCLDGIEVSDARGGETLARFPSQPGEIHLADAGYAFASGLGAAIWAGAEVIVRINWRNVAVFTPSGQRFGMLAWLRTVQSPSETPVWLETPRGWLPMRLIAAPLPPDKAEAARRRVRDRYQRKQQPISADTLFAAGFVLLLSTLPATPWTTERVLGLYRIRWQIEWLIRRLKSYLHLDALRARDPEVAQTYLLAKLLLALMIEQMTHALAGQQPDWFLSVDRPVSLGRLTQWFWEALRHIVLGAWFCQNLSMGLFLMRRYLWDSPRARPQQFAYARAFLEHINNAPFS
jgi:hypothetical protein